MGVVFSPEEVKFKQVPSKEDFLRAVEILKSGLRADPAILSALLLGSVVRGDCKAFAEMMEQRVEMMENRARNTMMFVKDKNGHQRLVIVDIGS